MQKSSQFKPLLKRSPKPTPRSGSLKIAHGCMIEVREAKAEFVYQPSDVGQLFEMDLLHRVGHLVIVPV
jgi:hypothetical protein